jgi:hypothetical protein
MNNLDSWLSVNISFVANFNLKRQLRRTVLEPICKLLNENAGAVADLCPVVFRAIACQLRKEDQARRTNCDPNDDPILPFPASVGFDCKQLCANKPNWRAQKACELACRAFFSWAPKKHPVGDQFLIGFYQEFKKRFLDEVKNLCARFNTPQNGGAGVGQK